MEFATRLRRAMGKTSISELSRRSGVPVSTIWRHLQGEHQPTLKIAQRYEAALPKLRLTGSRRKNAA